MQKSVTLIITLLCILYAGYVDAGFWNGEKLFGVFEKIEVNNSGYYSGLGTGYITGMLDAGFGTVFCPPAGEGAFTVGEAMRIVYHYMEKHPELLGKPAEQAVVGALQEAYPCESSKSNTQPDSLLHIK
jgi:Rap1a immunity proteins